MANFSRTWWGQRFLTAIEQITDSGRLGRGDPMLGGIKSKASPFRMDLWKLGFVAR